MATAGAGFAGVSLAEAYVMRSLHKEKMKKMENKEKEAKSEKMKKMESKEKEAKIRNDHKVSDEKKNPATGCFFFRVSKKTHSSKVSSADSTEKPV